MRQLIISMAVTGVFLKGRAHNIRRSSTILDTQTIALASAQPRAQGKVELRTKLTHKSSIGHLRQAGSLKMLFPRNIQSGLEAVLLNTAGGITGGDAFSVDVTVGRGSQLTMTTQAAERAYRAQTLEIGRQSTRISVEADATLHWLPQETILFDGSSFSRRLDISLAEGARALLVEPVVFGRIAMGEKLSNVTFRDRINVSYAGKALFADATDLTGDVTNHLAKSFIANGATAMALVAFIAPQAEGHLEPVRQMLPETAGASLIGENLLVARVMAKDSFELRQSLIPILARLSGASLPRCWMI